MRKIITWVSTTVDGYMEGPRGEGDLQWLMPHVPDSVADNQRMLEQEIDTILLGRTTYRGFAGYWPDQEGPFADAMNRPPKLVFASPGALQEVSWGSYGNAQLIDRDVEQRVRELKSQNGKDMVILASGGLVSSFLDLGLIDELRMGVCPVVLGSGKRYLRGLTRPHALELVDMKPYPAGSALMTYRVSADAPA